MQTTPASSESSHRILKIRTATVKARTPMKLVAVMNRDVWRLDRESPAVGAALRQTITDCLRSDPM